MRLIFKTQNYINIFILAFEINEFYSKSSLKLV